ncbi:hypothetical protein QJS04_geneDACA016170 [Acorus gramineus]|uniref:Uncharacterized protein n=1 Tax=Acorus gramineus TaxID=55184 RepID=A0AAV9AM91_ACOGR|nr:hypothetical protein QJS04_geneDACA016170 [Acorus gramineus]
MAGLQRSSVSFRRSGSSGLVWEDRFLSGDLKQMKNKVVGAAAEMRTCHSVGLIGMMKRSQSNGGGWSARSGKVAPVIDPPSPKVSGCGFFGIFGKSMKAKRAAKKGRFHHKV